MNCHQILFKNIHTKFISFIVCDPKKMDKRDFYKNLDFFYINRKMNYYY